MSRARILVIDDEPLIRSALVRALKHHDVIAVSSGAEAVERIVRGERFDVVLCDLMMPALDGGDVYEAACAADAGYASKFMFVTGGATTEKTHGFLAATTSEIVHKPFQPSALRERVATLIERERGRADGP